MYKYYLFVISGPSTWECSQENQTVIQHVQLARLSNSSEVLPWNHSDELRVALPKWRYVTILGDGHNYNLRHFTWLMSNMPSRMNIMLLYRIEFIRWRWCHNWPSCKCIRYKLKRIEWNMINSLLIHNISLPSCKQFQNHILFTTVL